MTTDATAALAGALHEQYGCRAACRAEWEPHAIDMSYLMDAAAILAAMPGWRLVPKVGYIVDNLEAKVLARDTEIARLRAALEHIADLRPIGPFRIPTDELAAAQAIARAALAPEVPR
jgi:hypothetical protein